MMENTPARRLPVRLPPYSDELLSCWIGRHAAFYAVPPLAMLRHCLPEAHSLRAADLHLSNDQESPLGQHLWHRAGSGTSDDLRKCRATIASAHCNAANAALPRTAALVALNRRQSCEANCWDGASHARCVENNSGMRTRANSPPLSSRIELQLFVAKSCSTMRPNVASAPGHRQRTLLDCC